MKKLSLTVAFILSIATVDEAAAAIIVNEAMVNEPASSTSLEWIELYNNSQSTGFINTHYVVIGSDTIRFASNLRLGPGEYFIICRKLFSDLTSPGFEGIWGDNSGVWGDTPYESSLQILYDVSFSLVNSGGKIEVYNAFNAVESEFQWTQPGQDGVSYERQYPDSAYILQSLDPKGGTPGIVNSVSPVGLDLSLEQIDVTPINGATNILFHLVNRSINIVSGAKLYLFDDPGDTSAVPTDTLDVFDLPDALPGFTTLVGGNYTLNGVYDTLLAKLTDDERLQNNRKSFVAPGFNFPPLIINEYLANPTTSLGSEWVELKNVSGAAIDLKNWQIGDALNFNTITDSSFFVYPGEYVVVVRDTTDFLNYYTQFNGLMLQPTGWSALNNSGDQIRLVDGYGYACDSLGFSTTYSDNYTRSLAESGVNLGLWGRSQESGGSPGTMNSVVFSSLGENVTLTITPEHFSPDGDGVDEVATFNLEAPEANSYSLKIYDRIGREVFSLFDNVKYLSPTYTWDGRDESGQRLPIGIYIAVFDVSGLQQIKKTFVIAR